MIERELERHIVGSNEAGLSVTSRQAQLKAMSYVRQADLMSTFKTSGCWLQRVKRMLEMKGYRPRQGNNLARVRITHEGMVKLLVDVGCTKPRYFYNMDETWLYPWAALGRTLALKPFKGRKKDMNHPMFLLMVFTARFLSLVRYDNTISLRKMTMRLGASGSTMVLRKLFAVYCI